MAHFLKYPTKSCKGIILLTHKEVSFFSTALKEIRFDSVNKISQRFFPKTTFKPYYQKRLSQLSENYFFGQHFGWYHRDYPTMPIIDFYLATKSTVTFANESNIYRIPLSSSSFINKAFEKKQLSKVWDIISVSHNGENKRLDSFFKSIRKLYDEKKMFKVLLINKAGIKESSKRSYITIEDDYNSMFSKEEREYFTLLRINSTLNFLGLSSQTIADFYNLSKVFTLFSEQEGEPRVVSEALLCGLPIVMYKHIKAGGVGLDNLNKKNSILFNEYQNAHSSLIKAVENYESFEIDTVGLKQKLREDYTTKTLMDYLRPLYVKIGQKFDNHFDNGQFLANAVNAHLIDVPWSRGRMQTADIQTKTQFNSFFEEAIKKIIQH